MNDECPQLPFLHLPFCSIFVCCVGLFWLCVCVSDLFLFLQVKGVHMNDERGAPVVCFGPDRVVDFLAKNALKLIVRGHECVMDRFQVRILRVEYVFT